jgi:cobalt-zinc-cadmium efflux system protein
MAHDHHHAPGTALARAGEAAKRPLAWALAITVVTLVVQVAVGIAAGSLSLLADGAHLLTDVGGLVLALAAVTLASRPTRDERTFGLYRLEVLSALANGVLLVAVAVWAIVEAVGRIQDPPDVPGAPVLVVGALGLVANLVALRLLGGGGSLASEGARVEVLADAVGSVGVVVGGGLILLTGEPVIDAWIGLAIGVWIVPRALRLAREAVRVLLQQAPPHVDLAVVRRDLQAIPDVTDVHDLHVWTLTTDMDVLTAHLMVGEGADHHRVLDDARDVLADHHDIVHATLQVEPDCHSGCDDVDW